MPACDHVVFEIWCEGPLCGGRVSDKTSHGRAGAKAIDLGWTPVDGRWFCSSKCRRLAKEDEERREHLT
jgi:hypothetical protein